MSWGGGTQQNCIEVGSAGGPTPYLLSAKRNLFHLHIKTLHIF